MRMYKVTVLMAQNLPGTGAHAVHKFFVRMKYGKQEFVTKSMKGTGDPEWEQSFIIEPKEHHGMDWELWEEKGARDYEMIGRCVITKATAESLNPVLPLSDLKKKPLRHENGKRSLLRVKIEATDEETPERSPRSERKKEKRREKRKERTPEKRRESPPERVRVHLSIQHLVTENTNMDQPSQSNTNNPKWDSYCSMNLPPQCIDDLCNPKCALIKEQLEQTMEEISRFKGRTMQSKRVEVVLADNDCDCRCVQKQLCLATLELDRLRRTAVPQQAQDRCPPPSGCPDRCCPPSGSSDGCCPPARRSDRCRPEVHWIQRAAKRGYVPYSRPNNPCNGERRRLRRRCV